MAKRDTSILPVMKQACDQCLYSKNKIVSDARKRRLLEHCRRTEKHFVCHKATEAGVDVMCRGHWDRTRNDTLRNRLAQVLEAVRYVEEEELAIRVALRRSRRA